MLILVYWKYQLSTASCCLLNDTVRTGVRADYPLPSLRVLKPSNNPSPSPPPLLCTGILPYNRDSLQAFRGSPFGLYCTTAFGILSSFIISGCIFIRLLYFLLFSFSLLLPSLLYSEVDRHPLYEVGTVFLFCSSLQGPSWSDIEVLPVTLWVLYQKFP